MLGVLGVCLSFIHWEKSSIWTVVPSQLKEGPSVLPACPRDGIVDISVFLVFNTRLTFLPTTQTFRNVYHDLNSSPPIMTIVIAEEITLDRDGSGPPDDLSGSFNDAYRAPENPGAGSESGKVQQSNNDSLFVDPSPLEVGNSQTEKDQGQVESTNLEASHSAPTLPVSENISIPSIIDTKHDPSHGPYERKECQPEWFRRSVAPYQELLDHDRKMKIQIEKGQSSPDNRRPGPIPSIMDMHQDLANGLYDPHQNNYTVLNTRLSRVEAKDLRDQIRNIGLDAFAAPEWKPHPDRDGTVSGWQFRHSRRRHRESISRVFRGDREGINKYLMNEEKFVSQKRISMIVQRDGGEVKVERIVTKPGWTLTHTVLEIFEDFEV